MNSDSSVTTWLNQLRDGDPRAAQQLWERYWSSLIAIAHARLSRIPRRVVDEEDAVQEALGAFLRAAQEGRYPQLADRNDLWRLLVVITLHKLHHQIRRNRSDKRALDRERELARGNIPEEILAQVPSPAEAVAMAEELQQIMARLEPLQRRMLELRLQGYNLGEIAAATERCPRTVCRTLELVKQLLQAKQAELAQRE